MVIPVITHMTSPVDAIGACDIGSGTSKETVALSASTTPLTAVTSTCQRSLGLPQVASVLSGITATPGEALGVRTSMSSRRVSWRSSVSRIGPTRERTVTPGTPILGVTANTWFGPGLALARLMVTPAGVFLYFVTASRSPATGTSIGVGGSSTTRSGGTLANSTRTAAVSNTGGFWE